MTKLLEQAFQKASKLPQEEQDAMAAFMMRELEHKNWLSAAGVSLERAHGPEEPDYSRAGVAESRLSHEH